MSQSDVWEHPDQHPDFIWSVEGDRLIAIEDALDEVAPKGVDVRVDWIQVIGRPYATYQIRLVGLENVPAFDGHVMFGRFSGKLNQMFTRNAWSVHRQGLRWQVVNGKERDVCVLAVRVYQVQCNYLDYIQCEREKEPYRHTI